jgi:hypothetical protein
MQEPRRCASVELSLAVRAGAQQRLTSGVELAMKPNDEREGVVGKHAFGVGHAGARHLDALGGASRHLYPR